MIIVQYLTKWLSICENIRTHHKVWQKLRIGSTCPRRLPQLRSQHYAHNSVLQTQLILRDEKLVYICETYQGQRIYLHMHLPCTVPTIGLYDHHVQLSDHSICCECSRKCSPGHASTAHKRHFLGPASAGLQPFVAAPRMVPAHVQSDSVMKDTNGTKYHITWKSALLWPNLLGLFCQNPLQVTVFCCLKQTTRWCTVSDTLIVDLRRNIIRVGSTRSALYLF